MGGSCKIFDYPVFALSYADGYIVASGGGGGDNYGISNKLEIYTLGSKFKSKDLHLEASTSEQNGIIDSLDYNHKHKLWIGSIDDSTILFTYKPKLGLKIFGKFKTDFIKKDPKQNICRFGYDSNYFVTGGNESCVRVWKISDKLLKKVHKYQKVELLDRKLETKAKNENKLKLRIRKFSSLINGEENISSEGDTDVDEMIETEGRKLLREELLLIDEGNSSVDLSDTALSSIDDTSPSVSPSSSPLLSHSKANHQDKQMDVIKLSNPEDSSANISQDMNGIDDRDNNNRKYNKEDNRDKEQNKDNKEDNKDNNKQIMKGMKQDDMCKLILEYREHLKPINDCCIYNELLVSLSNDCMIFYKLVPCSKLLMKYKDENTNFKFVKAIKRLSNTVSSPSPTDQVYALLTLQYQNTSKTNNDNKGGNINKQDKNTTTATLWNFNLQSKKLTSLKSVNISQHKSSSLGVDMNEEHFAVGFGNGSVSIYSIKDFKLIRKLNKHKLPVTDLTFTKKKLLTSGIDYYVFINNIKGNSFTFFFLIFLLLLFLLSIVVKYSYQQSVFVPR